MLNNIEKDFITLVIEILDNGTKDSNGKAMKYSQRDREKFIEIIQKNKKALNDADNQIPVVDHELLNSAYDKLIEILDKQLI